MTLDGKELKTPARLPLRLPTMKLALAIAAEWDAQVGHKGIQPTTMPLTTLACTAIDQVAADPNVAREVCLKYLPTDTALFFTSDEDRILLAKQKQHFQPIVRWFQNAFDVELLTTQNVSKKLEHPEDTVAKITHIVHSLVSSVISFRSHLLIDVE